MNDFGTRLRQARELRRLTQIEFAEQLGTTQTTISEYERGVRGTIKPDMSLLIRIAKVLNVSLDWLILGTGEPPK